jgi:hypothetical protein
MSYLLPPVTAAMPLTDLSLAPPAAPAPAAALAAADREFLLGLQLQALHYFLDNQTAGGLVLDRQRNRGPLRADGVCSLAATGMGCIALALASAPPYRLLSPPTAAERVGAVLRAALERLPEDHGVVPHFVDSATGAVFGADAFSTIETAWLVAGALWAAAFLGDPALTELAERLYGRVDWRYWTAPDAPGAAGLLRHGKDARRQFLGCSWDRLNGETAFMYVLAAGAHDGHALGADTWNAVRPFYGATAGLRYASADLGLFVWQYGADLLDLRRWRAPGAMDMWAEAGVAAEANRLACRAAADRFATFRRFWGLSAGDGPPDEFGGPDVYRMYAPGGPVDGTAHLTASAASVAHRPAAVLENLYEASREHRLPVRGRYGFSNVNLDRHWVSQDMVGIDAGAAVLALDNYLMADRVREVFHSLTAVGRAMSRLGFTPRTAPAAAA